MVGLVSCRSPWRRTGPRLILGISFRVANGKGDDLLLMQENLVRYFESSLTH